MKNGRISIGSIRREQIVEAAAAVIAEQGIQNLSLSEIEKKVGMSRGQLTYYFKTKEEILLAVFDRMLVLMCEQQGEGVPLTPDPSPTRGEGRIREHPFANLDWLDVVEKLLHMVLQEPAAHPEFHALQYTFLSQISHREDFRDKLAGLYEEWRGNMTAGLKRDMAEQPPLRKVSPRAMATLVQAMLHGLAMQKAADPDSITRAIVPLCLDLLRSYIWGSERPKIRQRKPNKREKVTHARNGKQHAH